MPGVIVDGNDFAAGRAGGFRRRRARPARRRADADRVQDLPHPRPFAHRPQPLPHQGRDRGLAWRATRSLASRRELARARLARRSEIEAIRARRRARDRRRRRLRQGEPAPDRLRDLLGSSAIVLRELVRERDAAMTVTRHRAAPRELTYAEAIQEALALAMEADRARVPDGRGHRRLWRRLPGDRRPRAALRRRSA